MKENKRKSVWKRLMASLLAVSMMSVMFTGCGGEANTSEQTASNTENVQQAQEKDTLKVALTDEPNFLSTCDHDSLAAVQMNLLTFNGLTRIDYETLTPVCDLAESYTQDSGLEWTFKLKQNIKFHDGSDCTAEDVDASLMYAKTFPGSLNYTGNIDHCEVVDPYTVKIVTSVPTPNLLADLAYHYNFILPKELVESGHNFSESPIGTGPYKFVSWNKGNDLKFEAFDGYFDDARKAQIKNLEFSIIPEGATRTMALEAGEVDFVYSVSTTDINRLKENSKVTVAEKVSLESFFLYLNCLNTPFKDENLRKAVSYALNREEIVVGALNGFGTPSYSCTSAGYAEFTDKNAYTYDLDKAKEYMAAWGGDPSTVTLDIICNNQTKKSIATIIQAQLAPLGINVTINEMDSATYQAAMTETELTAAIVSWSPSNAMTYVQRFHKSRRESTPTSMVNEELDKMIEEMNVTMDAEKRGEMITNIIAKTDELCPFVPIYLVNYFRAYDANLKNVVLGATGYVDFSTMSW